MISVLGHLIGGNRHSAAFGIPSKQKSKVFSLPQFTPGMTFNPFEAKYAPQ